MNIWLETAVVHHNTGDVSVFINTTTEGLMSELADLIRDRWWAKELNDPVPEMDDTDLVDTYFERCIDVEAGEYIDYDQALVEGLQLKHKDDHDRTN